MEKWLSSSRPLKWVHLLICSDGSTSACLLSLKQEFQWLVFRVRNIALLSGKEVVVELQSWEVVVRVDIKLLNQKGHNTFPHCDEFLPTRPLCPVLRVVRDAIEPCSLPLIERGLELVLANWMRGCCHIPEVLISDWSFQHTSRLQHAAAHYWYFLCMIIM